ncbi:MAG: Smr/MutS family protein [Parvularculaceae bacterium]
MKKRDLSGEERELWSLVTRDVKPAKKRKRKAAAVLAPPPRSARPEKSPDAGAKTPPIPIRPALSRVVKDQARARTKARLPPAFGAGDPKVDKKAAKGLIPIEARLDLHGMTEAAAHARVTRFILGAHADGLRLVLVITGKGAARGGEGRGVLRRRFVDWVELDPLRGAIARVATAMQKDGGEGAFYVFLKRKTRG